jgi:hypothetical protein
MPQSRIVICGVGLIGGSFALALKKAALAFWDAIFLSSAWDVRALHWSRRCGLG